MRSGRGTHRAGRHLRRAGIGLGRGARHGVAAMSTLLVLSAPGPWSGSVVEAELVPSPSTVPYAVPYAGSLAAPGNLQVPATVEAVRTVVASARTARPVLLGARDTGQLPMRALESYRRAATVMEQAAPGCGLDWPLLAAIGRVESDHGRYAGAVLGEDGVSRPAIRGIRLDGRGVAEIRDTDDGSLDGDPVWDRAVGPMQFLPGTWTIAGVDGDGDGRRDPDDLDDAALAAGVYLCAGADRLDQAAGMRTAVFAYNHSDDYVRTVLAYEREYRLGHYGVASGPTSLGTLPALDAGIIEVAARQELPAHPGREPEPPRPVVRPSTPVTTDPPKASAPDAGVPLPDPDPSPVPGPAPSPGVDPTPGSDPTPPPSAAPSPDGLPGPLPEPAPDPEPEPDPEPTPEPTPTPDPALDPTLVAVVGMWTACDDGYCLDGVPLDLGDLTLLVGISAQDYDGDGVLEEYVAELAGLVDRTVVVVFEDQETGPVVVAIADLPFLLPETELPEDQATS